MSYHRRVLLAVFLACFSFITREIPRVLAEASRPNVVVIFADDLGWRDVGFQGSDFYETPNIDRLATEGMVFPSAYACGGNCQPSRACLLSGLYTPRHEVYAVDSTLRGPVGKMRLTPVPNVPYLAPRFKTIAETLKECGYVTGLFGKWHLQRSDQPGTSPAEQGFDVVLEKNQGGGKGVSDDPKALTTLTAAACQFMEENRDKPFFVYLSQHAIHSPLQTTPKTHEKFLAKKPGLQHSNALYAGCIYDLDAAVQKVLDKLDTLQLSERTLVVFTSDNGGTPQSSQEPLRGNKGCYYEGGIREPFVARWNGTIAPGSVCEVPIVLLDLCPTFVDLATGSSAKNTALDGESLVPLFHGGKTLERESVFWHFPGYLDTPVPRGRDTIFRSRPTSVIRKGNWKLHLFHEEWILDGGSEKIDTNHCVELYNVRDDIGEEHDLSLSNKAKRDELLNDLLAWLRKTNAKFPTEKRGVVAP